MADSYNVKKITELAAKSASDDTDLYVIGNQGTATMRRISFATIAAAVRDKLTSLTFPSLNTSNKTLPGAVNELNSKWKAGAAPSAVFIAAGSYEERTYSFGVTFSATPKVQLTLFGSGDNGYRGSVSAFVARTTTTEVTVRFYNNSNASLSVGLQWLAIL